MFKLPSLGAVIVTGLLAIPGLSSALTDSLKPGKTDDLIGLRMNRAGLSIRSRSRILQSE